MKTHLLPTARGAVLLAFAVVSALSCFEQGKLPTPAPGQTAQVSGSEVDPTTPGSGAQDTPPGTELIEPDLMPDYCPPSMMRDFENRCVCLFPDPALDQVIRGLINKPTGSLYLSDLANIQEVVAMDKGIRDIDGVQCLVRVNTLVLTRNQIVDVTPVKDLVRLQVLSFLRNRVRDVSALSRLTQLAMLDIGKNGLIEDASVLANMPNLITVHMEQNRIGSLDPVKSLVHLQTLDAHNNQFRDVSAVRDLAELVYLHLSCLKTDGITYPGVSAISHKPRLHTLSLVGCDLDDDKIAGISDLPELREINLDQNRLTSLGFLSAFPKLEQLIISNNQLTQISGLASTPNLVTLFLSQNQVSDLAVLGSGFPALSTLYVNNNAVTDLGPLSANAGFGAGDVINVYGNPFSCEAQQSTIQTLTDRGATLSSQCN